MAVLHMEGISQNIYYISYSSYSNLMVLRADSECGSEASVGVSRQNAIFILQIMNL